MREKDECICIFKDVPDQVILEKGSNRAMAGSCGDLFTGCEQRSWKWKYCSRSKKEKVLLRKAQPERWVTLQIREIQ